MGRQKELVNRCGEMLHIRYRLLRQALAECLGTLILVVSGGTCRSLLPAPPPQSLSALSGLTLPLGVRVGVPPGSSLLIALTPSVTALTLARMTAVTPQ